LVCRGEREVITHDGVTGTPDHKVFVDPEGEPIALGEAKRRKLRLAGDYGRAEWYWLRRLCQSAKFRCENTGGRSYGNYGGRGITFGFADGSEMAEYVRRELGRRPTPDHSLDRINNNEGYAPGNLRWATRAEQANNKREYRGQRYGGRIRELLRQRPDLVYETIRAWIKEGLSDAEILARKKTNCGRPRTATSSPHVGDSRHAK
jgi:hypothetical protein